MTEKEMKQIKMPDMSGIMSIGESLKRMSAGAIATPRLEKPIDTKTEMMARMEQSIAEMKENSKNSFWKNLLIAVIGGIVGGAVPYFLVFFF